VTYCTSCATFPRSALRKNGKVTYCTSCATFPRSASRKSGTTGTVRHFSSTGVTSGFRSYPSLGASLETWTSGPLLPRALPGQPLVKCLVKCLLNLWTPWSGFDLTVRVYRTAGVGSDLRGPDRRGPDPSDRRGSDPSDRRGPDRRGPDRRVLITGVRTAGGRTAGGRIGSQDGGLLTWLRGLARGERGGGGPSVAYAGQTPHPRSHANRIVERG